MSSPDVVSDDKLFRTWTFWYLIPDRYKIPGQRWNDYLHALSTFDTIDEMWAVFNSVGAASQLPKGSRFYIFKKGIRPLWEDHANVGGKVISIEHPIQRAKKPKIADRWMDLVLAVLGETIANSDAINGVEFTVRKETYNIAIWAAPSGDEIANGLSQELTRLVRWQSQVKVTPIEVSPPK
jgi:translation initiation factor 4E